MPANGATRLRGQIERGSLRPKVTMWRDKRRKRYLALLECRALVIGTRSLDIEQQSRRAVFLPVLCCKRHATKQSKLSG